jgi:hypothetical protein
LIEALFLALSIGCAFGGGRSWRTASGKAFSVILAILSILFGVLAWA